MKSKVIIVLFTIFLFSFSGIVLAENELEDGSYYTLYDENNNVLLRTGIVIHVGDKFIDHNNIHYVVYKVDSVNLKAWAKKIDPDEVTTFTISNFAQLKGADQRRIGLYYTHSGESYVPSDGYAQTDRRRGGIYKVGERLAQRLEELEVEVINNRRTHFPYAGSYRRSRRTAKEIIDKKVDAIFDVHRDATPVNEYLEEINGEKITQVLIVVGRQNPAFKVNEEFALKLKAVGDEMYPKLVKGIFYARGGYNQDLHPRALLLEIGAHTNKREHAERGAELFAEVITKTLYGDLEVPKATEELEENPKSLEEEENNDPPKVQSTVNSGGTGRGGLLKGMMIVLLLTVIGGGGYLLISVGDTREIERKIRNFLSKEFANALIGKKGKKEK
ncbi:stage II sporulation protein P [Anaerobranca gottschalkii]|uniref:Stage II sporulation protein P n=1 Tax=Anaerobranca gottschalkii DSM 13577 TaxID=1120990 RepID=A0A1H9ZRQ9_9FIRM|nr:stage II sporulation protein P [Anaerobranca gottschalkii]SES84317.1 stage II sporulation protein P [Anaerobranca gottschalkii DSM 13577]